MKFSIKLGAVMTISAFSMLAGIANATTFSVFKSPWCGCCENWVNYLKENGHTVSVKEIEDLSPIKKSSGISEKMQSCHTAVVDGYIIEGHVPVREIDRLLTEKPDVIGLSVPGMVAGSPGMEGGEPEPYNVMVMNMDGSFKIYAQY